MRRATIFIVLAFLAVLFATPALANGIPKLPHAFYGSVTVNGAPAAAGTQISATVDIGEIIPTQNPVNTVGGSYGTGGNPYLLVQGYDIPDGATIAFHVTNANGTATGGTATFLAGGGPTQKNLSVTIAVPEPPPTGGDGGGGGSAPAPTIKTDVFGTTGSIKIDSKGIVQETFTATSEDGKLTLTIPKGTKALDKDGNPLANLTASIDESPPSPPENANVIGLAYDFGPDGATFDPPLTLTWSYDPDSLPEGVAEENLVIAYYDEDASEWVELECVVDTENNKITASVHHFTTFAIIGKTKPAAFSLSSLVVSPTEVNPGEKVNVSMSVANTGGREGSYTVVLKVNGVKEAEKSVTLGTGKSQEVSFSVIREEAGSYTVTVDGASGIFTVVAPPVPPPPAPAAFSVMNLSIQPAQVQPKEAVTITMLVANTGGSEGNYTVVLKVNGAKEAEKSVTLGVGKSQEVSFSVTREEAGSYTVTVDGASGSFTVVALSPTPPPATVKPTNWPLIGGIIGGAIVVGVVIFYLARMRRD